MLRTKFTPTIADESLSLLEVMFRHEGLLFDYEDNTSRFKKDMELRSAYREAVKIIKTNPMGYFEVSNTSSDGLPTLQVTVRNFTQGETENQAPEHYYIRICSCDSSLEFGKIINGTEIKINTYSIGVCVCALNKS